MDLGIKGKNAIICASSRGLGKACASSLALNGVNVVLNVVVLYCLHRNYLGGLNMCTFCCRWCSVPKNKVWMISVHLIIVNCLVLCYKSILYFQLHQILSNYINYPNYIKLYYITQYHIYITTSINRYTWNICPFSQSQFYCVINQ